MGVKALSGVREMRYRLKANLRLFRLRHSRRPVRVAFVVVTDSCFQLEDVFRLMLADRRFEPIVVVAPDTSRGEAHMHEVMTRTFSSLSAKYGEKVRLALVDGKFVDIAGQCDMCTVMNPYSGMTDRRYSIPHFFRQGVPVFFSRYFFDSGSVWSEHFNVMPEISMLWRFYVDSPRDARLVAQANPPLARRGGIVASGVAKIDRLAAVPLSVRSRKRIILSPHHTVSGNAAGKFQIGNFISYADYFLTLPARYPQVDWVFRPHPLLLTALVVRGIWNERQRDDYLAKMTAYSNVEYQRDGDYAETFVNSDGLIQDCASFLPEYYHTGHPQCYILADHEAAQRQFGAWGQRLLEHVYLAYDPGDIDKFVERVVLAEEDPMKEERERFFRAELGYNYPNASRIIYNDIRKALGCLD